MFSFERGYVAGGWWDVCLLWWMIGNRMNLKITIESLFKKRDEEKEISFETLKLVEDAIQEFPDSSKLLCIKADFIQLSCEENPYELSDSLRAYKRALEIDPNCAEAFEGIGYYYDVFEEQYELAREAFEKALEIEERLESIIGLARIRAELNEKSSDIVSFLENTSFKTNNKVEELINEIND